MSGHMKIAVAAVALVGAVLWGYTWYWGSEDTQTCTVTRTDRTTNPDTGASVYRVYTEECDVLEVKDVWLRGQADAASVYGQIEEDRKYEFTTIGWRFPLFSTFPVIIEVNEE